MRTSRTVLAASITAAVAVPVGLAIPKIVPALRGVPRALGASTRTVLRSLPHSGGATVRPTAVPSTADRPTADRSVAELTAAAGGNTAPDRAASGLHRPRRHVSDHHRGRTFHNRQPSSTLSASDIPRLMAAYRRRGPVGRPIGRVDVVTPDTSGVAADLAVTWLGHASVLLEIDGARLLFDPVVEDRVSPSATVGPERLHGAPLTVDALPSVDAVVISHDHYDHLEDSTIIALAQRSACRFVVPLGIGAHLRSWGVPAARIDELDWDDAVAIGPVTLTCTEARHFSGRFIKRDVTLWSSWAVAGPRHRVFFGGDTGYTPAFGRTGALYGPFDLTILPIGAYHPAWGDIHMDPEEALRAHGDLGGSALLPIHWATFDLALHAWDEPIERLLRGNATGSEPTGRGPVRLGTPRPGARWDLAGETPQERWWRPLAPPRPDDRSSATDTRSAHRTRSQR